VVKGDTLDAAKAALQAQHLQFTVQQVGSNQPKGTVLGTKPKAGTVWPQTQPVVLLVVGGPPLPDFHNMSEDAAKQLAAQDHITLNAVLDTTSNLPPGTVVSQSPKPGSVMTSGEQVTINVSQGPQEVPIPDVITMRIGQARQILQQAGFRVVVNGSDFFGRVTDETPIPIGSAPYGSVIVLQVDPFGGGGNGNGNGGNGN
jgi:serine/threonine-protein kinase